MNKQKSLPGDADTANETATTLTRLQGWFGKLKHLKATIVAIASVGAVLSGLVGYYTTYRAVASQPASNSAASVAFAVNPLSVMVLPFANHTGDEKKAYIADALTSAITTDLTRIQDAFIVPSTTATFFRDKQRTLSQLGQEAGVRFVLTGSVIGIGEQLRINAQLSDTQSGAQLWTANFEGNHSDLFALQDQVTTRIGNSIGPAMIIVAARDSEKRRSTPQVADLLMRSRALRLHQQSLQNWRELEGLSRKVLTLEPENIYATMTLARSLANQAYNYSNQLKLNSAATIALAKQAGELAQKVRAVDPDNPAIYNTLVLVALLTGNLDSALQASKRGLELDPRSEIAYRFAGIAMNAIGDADNSKVMLEKGLQFSSPARTPVETYRNLALSAFMRDKPDEAIQWAQKAVNGNPTSVTNHKQLVLAFALKGDATRAHNAAAEALRLDPQLSLKTERRLPWPGKEQEYRRFIETKLEPAWRLAGLPE